MKSLVDRDWIVSEIQIGNWNKEGKVARSWKNYENSVFQAQSQEEYLPQDDNKLQTFLQNSLCLAPENPHTI